MLLKIENNFKKMSKLFHSFDIFCYICIEQNKLNNELYQKISRRRRRHFDSISKRCASINSNTLSVQFLYF